MYLNVASKQQELYHLLFCVPLIILSNTANADDLLTKAELTINESLLHNLLSVEVYVISVSHYIKYIPTSEESNSH